MPRILAVDYGTKRCGIAETDDLQIIASALETVSPSELLPYLRRYTSKYAVDALAVGLPVRMGGELSAVEEDIAKFIEKFEKEFPDRKSVV